MRTRNEQRIEADSRRGTRTERGYDNRWLRASESFAREHPFCEFCLRDNPDSVSLGEVTDHVIPHRGDMVLFWDMTNWQRLCCAHHDGEKQRIEIRAARTGEGIRALIASRACAD